MKRAYIILILSAQIQSLVSGQASCGNKTLEAIKPDHAKVQFAGNIGVISAGLGYSFLKGRLASDLLIGYVPEGIGNTSIVTVSQKNSFLFQNFKPEFLKRFYASSGFSVNVETGNNSFFVLPDRYPNGYYGTNAFTFSLFAGLNYQGKIRNRSTIKRIEYYAEIGTLATYLYYGIKQRDYLNPEIWNLALGIKLYLNQ